MKLTDIFDMWKTDSVIDRTELGHASLQVPILHGKYYKILVEERTRLKAYKDEYSKLYRVKHEYFLGLLDTEEIKQRGWNLQPLKILKADLSIYINSDEDLSLIDNKISIQEEKIDLLESIIKVIVNRGYSIRNAIDWERFKVGA